MAPRTNIIKMKYFTKKCKWFVFLTAIGLVAFYGCGKIEQVDDLATLQALQEESFVRGEGVKVELQVQGTVIDPITCLPLANATVTTGSFSTITDVNGNFTADINTTDNAEIITVNKDGYVNYDFPVSYRSSPNGTTLNWTINLSPRQSCVWVGPEEGAWYRITVSGVEYTIDIRRGTVDAWTQICTGPSGSAIGQGIPLAYAAIGLSVETPEAADVVFNFPVDVRYNSLEAFGSKGGIGSGSIHTETVNDLIAAGASLQEIGDALYGANNYTISPSGAFVFNIPFSSEYVLIAGLQAGGFLFSFQADGLFDEATPLINEAGSVEGIPHQSVGDGGG